MGEATVTTVFGEAVVRRSLERLGEWVEDNLELLVTVEALKDMGPEGAGAASAILAVPPVKRVVLSWGLLAAVAQTEGVDLGARMREVLPEDLVALVESALLDGDHDDPPRWGRLLAIPVSLGERIRRRRRSLGLTQVEAGRRLGVDQSTVAKWEAGRRMESDRLPDVAHFLGVPVAQLTEQYLAAGR